MQAHCLESLSLIVNTDVEHQGKTRSVAITHLQKIFTNKQKVEKQKVSVRFVFPSISAAVMKGEKT